MTIKITELPSISSTSLLASASTPVLPVVSTVSGNVTTSQTSLANIKSYISTGNLNLTGGITANSNSTIYGNLTVTGTVISAGNLVTPTGNVISTGNFVDTQTDANLSYPVADNGRDVGSRFFYYKGAGNAAALVWKNTNGRLTWYDSGAGNTASILSGSASLGVMQVGGLIVSNSTVTTGNATGALQVGGGISTGGNLWVVGDLTGQGAISTSGKGTFATLQANGATTLGSTLIVTGVTTVNYLNVNNYATVGSTLVVGSNATVNALTVNNSATVGSTLGVTGATILSGTLTTAGIVPSANATYNIGSSSYQYNTVYSVSSVLSGTLTTANIVPSANATYNIGSSSYQYNTVYSVSSEAVYGDLAERYAADSDYEPGTVVVFGGEKEITVTANRADYRVAGVISTEPAYLMSSTSEGLPVALRGKVPVKVVGKVCKGDLLVTSTTPGFAESGAGAMFGSPNSVFAKSLVDDDGYHPRNIWAVIL